MVAATTRTSTGIERSPPTRVMRALLERAEHLGLRVEAHVADLVEEERAAVGLLELADALLRRARERALLVAEQLALDELGRDRGAVDLDERAVARGRCWAWRWRATSSLPVPGSPVMSTRASVGATRAMVAWMRPMAGLSPTMGVRSTRASSRTSLLQADVLDLELPARERAADRHEEPVEVRRLLEEVDRAELRRLDGRLDGPVARDHHDRDRGLGVVEGLEDLHAVPLRHLDVEQDEVDAALARARERLVAVDGLLDGVALELEDLAERAPDGGLVVGDEDGRGIGQGHGRGELARAQVRRRPAATRETRPPGRSVLGGANLARGVDGGCAPVARAGAGVAAGAAVMPAGSARAGRRGRRVARRRGLDGARGAADGRGSGGRAADLDLRRLRLGRVGVVVEDGLERRLGLVRVAGRGVGAGGREEVARGRGRRRVGVGGVGRRGRPRSALSPFVSAMAARPASAEARKRPSPS